MTRTALVYSRFVRAAQCCAMVALVMCLARPSEAGVQNIPCRRPFVFQGAAVNVVVLPYQSAPGLTAAGDLGEHLAGLLQLEVLRAIAKFGSVGAVQMVGSEADCDPELVVAKLLGRTPGAAATVRKGHGLVVVWGRFYREGGNVFVQTFCRFLRSGITETLEITAAGRPFAGQISGQAFACAPRKVTVADLANFEQQFRRSTIVRQTPQETASGSPMPQGPLPYWISDTQGDWMKIASQDGMSGWIRLSGSTDSWSLVRWLPELTYIEGMVGYLRTRIAAQQGGAVRSRVDRELGARAERLRLRGAGAGSRWRAVGPGLAYGIIRSRAAAAARHHDRDQGHARAPRTTLPRCSSSNAPRHCCRRTAVRGTWRR